MKVLDIRHLVKSYGHRRAVDGVSFCLQQGDNIAIIGESGCGKTTLAKMIMGLIRPDEGSVEAAANSLQMVFQDPNHSLDPLWDVRAILKEALWAKPSVADPDKIFTEMLAAVGLPPDILNRFPHEFSGGERQRIAIARALLAGPRVVILDEATSALDTLVQKQILDLLRKLKRDFNLTYIFISHNLRLVRNFSDKIMVMHQGKIVEEGATAVVLEAPVHPYTRQLLEAALYTHL